MSVDARLRRLELASGPIHAVGGWLDGALEHASEEAYVQACLRMEPPFRPDRWILSGLADRRRRASRGVAAPWADDRRDALTAYVLAQRLLRDGDSEFTERYWPLRLFTMQLGSDARHALRGSELEDVIAAERIARVAGAELLDMVGVADGARRAIERRYFAGRDVRYAGARSSAEPIAILLDLLDRQLRTPDDANLLRRVVEEAEVDEAVRRRILDAQAVVTMQLQGPVAAVPILRELMLVSGERLMPPLTPSGSSSTDGSHASR
jgi:hypothetical protein